MSSPGITKKAIAPAIRELMAEQTYAKSSIGEIVARCELNRNSFYYHLKDN